LKYFHQNNAGNDFSDPQLLCILIFKPPDQGTKKIIFLSRQQFFSFLPQGLKIGEYAEQ